MDYFVIRTFYFLLLAFFAVLFLQSGLDKVTDRKGNLDWLLGHFSKSPLAKEVPTLLSVVTVLEVTTGVVNALSAPLIYIINDYPHWALFIPFALATLTLLVLFAGQRIAKDYTGAAGIVPYFLLAVFAMSRVL